MTMIKLDIRKKRKGSAWASRPEFDYLTLQQGEAGITREFALTDSGAPFDLTGRTVTFKAWDAKGGEVEDAYGAVVTDAPHGRFTYTFPAGLQAEVGDCACYFEVYQNDERICTSETFPLCVFPGVRASIGR